MANASLTSLDTVVLPPSAFDTNITLTTCDKWYCMNTGTQTTTRPLFPPRLGLSRRHLLLASFLDCVLSPVSRRRKGSWDCFERWI
jgi:hypothetical protein